jgi:hypothetical protein
VWELRGLYGTVSPVDVAEMWKWARHVSPLLRTAAVVFTVGVLRPGQAESGILIVAEAGLQGRMSGRGDDAPLRTLPSAHESRAARLYYGTVQYHSNTP